MSLYILGLIGGYVLGYMVSNRPPKRVKTLFKGDQ